MYMHPRVYTLSVIHVYCEKKKERYTRICVYLVIYARKGSYKDYRIPARILLCVRVSSRF